MRALTRTTGLALLVGLCACAAPRSPAAVETGGRQEPDSRADKRILAELDALRPGDSKTVAGVTVDVESSYYAASGRRCRWLLVRGESLPERRLACKEGDGGWFYAPDVLIGRADAEAGRIGAAGANEDRGGTSSP